MQGNIHTAEYRLDQKRITRQHELKGSISVLQNLITLMGKDLPARAPYPSSVQVWAASNIAIEVQLVPPVHCGASKLVQPPVHLRVCGWVLHLR